MPLVNPKLKPVKKENDPRYGPVDIFTDTNGNKQYICISATSLTDPEAQSMLVSAKIKQKYPLVQYQTPVYFDIAPIN